MKKLIIAVAITLMVIGCTTTQDKSPAPIDHGMRTLELISCDQGEVGLLGCFFNEEKKGTLLIPVYGEGEYVATSNECGIAINESYGKDDRYIKLSYSRLLENRPDELRVCNYDLKVFPDGFDKGFRGNFLLYKKKYKSLEFSYKGDVHNGLGATQVREGNITDHLIKFPQLQTPGVVFWEGCDLDDEISYEKTPSISLKDVLRSSYLTEGDSCILTIGVLPNDLEKPVEFGKFQINIYGKPVVPLAVPDISYREGKLKIKFDKIVAAYAVNDRRKVLKKNSSRTFRREADKNEIVWLRWVTSNGRGDKVGIKNGEVVWTSYLR